MSDFRIYKNTRIGEESDIGNYSIIGYPARNRKDGEVATEIGRNARIRSHTVIYAGNRIGDDFQTGHHVMLREENVIGDNVSIGSGTIVEHHVIIQSHVRIHSQAFVPEYSTLEEGCWLGPYVVLTNVLHPLCPEVSRCIKGATIRKNAKIGANATLLPDIEVGEGALVGAGSVVVNNVPPGVVVAGNPARVVKKIDELLCPYEFVDKPY